MKECVWCLHSVACLWYPFFCYSTSVCCDTFDPDEPKNITWDKITDCTVYTGCCNDSWKGIYMPECGFGEDSWKYTNTCEDYLEVHLINIVMGALAAFRLLYMLFYLCMVCTMF